MPESTPKFRQIEELTTMRPFRPFTVETKGGSKPGSHQITAR
jgi:hypothetical protein